MLRLKRASAGSGKTYQLAKTYIKLLLTYKQGKQARRLRHETTVRDALTGIMAVTFTVKATAEMKQRIVEKLADLAKADMMGPEELKKVDYLEEFQEDLNTNRFEIARLARKALSTLLLHYSDFKVQTIDSFFQSILHTFAYEANLDDSFNMELDTDFITSVGLDTALDDISEETISAGNNEQTLHWLKEMMGGRLEKKKWNVFSRQSGKDYLYSDLIFEAKNLEKESYQNIREELQKYFAKLDRPFSEVVEEVDAANYAKWEELHRKRREAALELKKLMDRLGLDEKDLYRSQGSKLTLSLKEFDRKNFNLPNTKVSCGSGETAYSLSGAAKKKIEALIRANPDVNRTVIFELDAAYTEWMEANNNFMDEDEQNSEGLQTWQVYRSMLPRLMLVLEIARRKESYLKATNSLQISDTNRILSEIIDGEETPFVYERMGSRLDHYLIDEFQDTSKMQWDNLYPLLSNSDSMGHENMIIGDAKQSIYRFRNADYRLILEVENRFPEVVGYTTEKKPKDTRKENTNYRSKRKVVEFNNHVFSSLTKLEKGEEGESAPLFSPVIKEIYRDTVQACVGPDQGYVELILDGGPDETETREAGKVGRTSLAETGFRELPGRILEIVGRGYKFSDIGILVKSHEHGMAAVKAISAHNAVEGNVKIPVISEEDLLVASALSVRLIIHALEIAARGLTDKLPENPVLPEPIDEESLFELLGTLQSLALPSVVEALTERFVPEKLKESEAPFIAAFQDAVVDYSSARSNDIGSFLKWWQQISKGLSITSPEDSDGVKLQTIHKAKGLEYKCVIIPKGSFNFEPGRNQNEWRWIEPHPCIAKRELLPPLLPVETSQDLEKTFLKEIRERYCEEFGLDELNKMYVGFTRAIDELYVYLPINNKGDYTKAGNALRVLLAGTTDEDGLLSESPVIEETEDRFKIRYGSPITPDEIKEEKRKKAKKEGDLQRKIITIDSYSGTEGARALKIEDGNKLLKVPVHTGTSKEELDPRAEGNIKHRIMQMVETPADLDKALLSMKVGGMVTDSQIEEWGRTLKEAIASVEDKGWFAAGNRVLNERSILQKGKEPYRPDRIVESRPREAIVIDYKFGVEDNKYKEQITNYAELLAKTGRYSHVEAWLWYVEEGTTERVV